MAPTPAVRATSSNVARFGVDVLRTGPFEAIYGMAINSPNISKPNISGKIQPSFILTGQYWSA
jgi:hypothetical protein